MKSIHASSKRGISDRRVSVASLSQHPFPPLLKIPPFSPSLSHFHCFISGRLKMSSPATFFRLSVPAPSVAPNTALSFPISACLLGLSSGVCCFEAGWKHACVSLPRTRCSALPKSRVMSDVLPNNMSVIERPETLSKEDKSLSKVLELSDITKLVGTIKIMLQSMDDGEISISAYDTAWVALVEEICGRGGPQFPTSLWWILDNQLPDGSWGDERVFSAHDRILNTLACVVALKYWNIHPEKRAKGLCFLRDNLKKLEDEDAEHMPIGFEVAFPSLLEIARSLDLEFPYDSPVLQDTFAKRNLKLMRIPKEMMHKVPTTLLHSLEGMPDLDWQKLLKLQSEDGSFLFSPSSTAFALKQTKDKKCLKYLQKIVEKFNGGVPNVYPVDMFEHIWAVDRLERLGISRYFKTEIKDCLDYVYRYWKDEGICWARNTRVRDVDDTAMGFRILRLHGYDVSPDAFRHFENGGEFFCFAGQSNQAITGIYNLNRASQVMFPGEKILEEAKSFTYKFLREKQASNMLLDKWIITKDLPGEVEYALDFPWYATLPRVETKFYLGQYGGENDVWIGKTLYRMPFVNNNTYLKLAKLDFNECQALHQLEWLDMQKWYEGDVKAFGLTQTSVLQAYFLAAASIFEPERAAERVAWARTAVLVEAVSSYVGNEACTADEKRAFLREFTQRRSGSNSAGKGLVRVLLENLRHLSLLAHGSDAHGHLRRAWESWLLTWHEGEDNGHDHQKKFCNEAAFGEAELLVRTINVCAGRSVSDDLLSHPHYVRLACRTNGICNGLRRLRSVEAQRVKGNGIFTFNDSDTQIIESEMQELVQLVLQRSDGIDQDIKQTFLTIAKSFYYRAHCPLATFHFHIKKVLFDKAA